ncbi:MAG: hypothetical protein GEV28_40545 [Actinophytocola sp.]|uniref:hypothetical protein n=1 Tax=Actinophytocola sp. TaxID=1872138 RepID=UPI00132A04DE|nr:hypothetical protein [Actinophytocola sp.]MPZ86327.1 hypothetical protein [Actinophytocola sp.]
MTGISPLDQRAIDRLRERLEHYGVLPVEYGILAPEPDALVLEQVPGGGWQVRFWDASRGPGRDGKVFEHAVDAAKVLLATLLWSTDLDDSRARYRASRDQG